MIPDFKTYIKESHWSEMNRRSQGVIKRKEDDVNNLNLSELYDYIYNNYNMLDENDLTYSLLPKVREPYSLNLMPIWKENNYVELKYFKNKDNEMEVSVSRNIAYREGGYYNLYKALKETYKLYDTVNYNRTNVSFGIAPQNGSKPTNRFLLEVLDFIIEQNPVPNCLEITKKKK
jgi:hypothetical protein